MGCALLHGLHSGEGRRGQAEDARITHSSLHFPPTSMAPEDSRKGAAWGRGVQGLSGLNGGPQIPINTVKVSFLCTCLHARVCVCVCVCVCIGGTSLFPILESWLLCAPGTIQHPRPLTLSDPGNSKQDQLHTGPRLYSPLCYKKSSLPTVESATCVFFLC